MNKALDAHMATKKDSKQARGTVPKQEKPSKTPRKDANTTSAGVSGSNGVSSSSSSNAVQNTLAQTVILSSSTTKLSSPILSHSQQTNLTAEPAMPNSALTSADSNSTSSVLIPPHNRPVVTGMIATAAIAPSAPLPSLTADQVNAKITAAISAAVVSPCILPPCYSLVVNKKPHHPISYICRSPPPRNYR